MTATTHTADSRSLAFLDGTARIIVSRTEGERDVSVIEIAMPAGAMPPPHVHDEAESVYVLEGEVTFHVGHETIRARASDEVELPRGVAHTYRVESRQGARWLSVTSPGRFEDFVRAVARPSETGTPALATLAELVAFTAAAARNGIEIVGAPGSLPAGPPRAAELAAPASAPRFRLRVSSLAAAAPAAA